MDFIVGLPKAKIKLVIIVVVGHLSKYAHFCALQHPLKASTEAYASLTLFLNHIECINILWLIIISCLLVISGKSCFDLKELNWISTKHITPILVARRKQSTNVWKLIYIILLWFNKPNGSNGYPWFNGGIIPPIMVILKWCHLRQPIYNHPHQLSHTYKASLRFRRWKSP